MRAGRSRRARLSPLLACENSTSQTISYLPHTSCSLLPLDSLRRPFGLCRPRLHLLPPILLAIIIAPVPCTNSAYPKFRNTLKMYTNAYHGLSSCFLLVLLWNPHDCIACYQCLFLHMSLLCSYRGSTHLYASSLSSCMHVSYRDTIYTHRRTPTYART